MDVDEEDNVWEFGEPSGKLRNAGIHGEGCLGPQQFLLNPSIRPVKGE